MRVLGRFIARTLLALTLVVVLLFALVQIPSVQTRLAKWGIDYLEKNVDVLVDVDAVRFSYPWKITADGLKIFTLEGDSVLSVPKLEVVPGRPQKNMLRISSLRLYEPYAQLELKPGDSITNWQYVIRAFMPENPNPDFVFEMGEIKIVSGSFVKRTVEGDVQHNLRAINCTVRSFRFAGGGVDATIESGSFAGRRLNVHELKGNFAYRNDQGIAFSRARIRTDASTVDADIYLDVDSNDDYADFANNVNITAQFHALTLSSEELHTYVPAFPKLGVLLFKGKVRGTLASIVGEDVQLQYGHKTSLRGDIAMRHLLSPAPTALDVNLRYIRSNYEEFSNLMYALSEEDLSFLKPYVNTFTFSGYFNGSRASFKSNGTLLTDIGAFDLALNVKAGTNPLREASFSGRVDGKQVKIGALLDVPDLDDASFAVDVAGRGLTKDLLDMQVKGSASVVGFRGYDYRNVRLDGRMQSLYFEGEIGVDDPNLRMSFDGTAFLEPGDLRLDFLSNIAHADLYKLGVTSIDSTYTVQAEAVVNVAQTNDWVGEVNLSNAFIERSHRVYFFRDVRIASYEMGENNILSIHSDFLNGRLTGTFQLLELHKALYNYAASYSSFMEPYPLRAGVHFTGNMSLGDTRLITDLLFPSMEIYPGSALDVAYEKNRFRFTAHMPGVRFGDYDLRDLDVDLSRGIFPETPIRIHAGSVQAGQWLWKDVAVDTKLVLDSMAFDITTAFDQGGGGRIHLKGVGSQNDTASFAVQLFPTSWQVGGGSVNIEPNNQLRWNNGAISVENLSLESDGRRMKINGSVSASPYEILRVQVDSFSVDAFNFLTETQGFSLKGILEGEIIFNSLLGEPRFASDLRVDSLFINDHWQGDFYFDSEWYINEQFVELDFHLDRGKLRTLEVSGKYLPESETEKLQANIIANRFRILPFTPLFSSFTDDVKGVASGQIALTGTMQKPLLNGRLTVPNLGLSIPYLNTFYNLQGAPEIIFESERILIPSANIVDSKEGTSGVARADLRHQHFKDWKIDVHIDADKLLALNTNAVLNDYFYGKVYISGDVDITGPTEDLRFDVDVTTHRGTEFYIPVDGPTDVNPMGFVDFVKVADQRDTITQRAESAGLNLQININVTPEAEVYLIMDQRTGETIKGNGRGRLRFTLDPQGNIGLFGSLEVNRGEYLFTLGGLVRKRFFIEPGGSISFNGSPYEAILDLSTKYVTRTSLSGAVADPTLAAVRTEVNLFLNLSGLLTNPEIAFDIKLPNVAPGIQAEVSDRFSDPNRLTQQAFSLLALNSFYTDDLALDAQVQGGLASTTIDVFAGQVNNFLSQYIKVIDIAVNYTGEGVTGASQEEFELAVSRRLFDDRISINGVVGVPLGANQNQLAGDVEVELMLTQDGRVRAKAFNRSYQNNLLIEQTGLYSQGVGLFYRTDFNRRRELLKRLLFISRSTDAEGEEDEVSPDADADAE